jgi:hypothetical protein
MPLISGEQNQFILCAEVYLETGTDGKRFIASINNLCPLITGTPLSNCHFAVEDSRDEHPDPNTAMVEVRVGTLNGVLPMDMHFGKLGTDRFLIDLPATQGEWFAIYLVVALDNTGNISSAANALQFVAYNDYQKVTSNYAFLLAAEVNCSYNSRGERYISSLFSYCIPQFWNTIGQGQCPFLVYDSSKMVGQAKVNQVSVSRGLVDGMWPNGMGPDPTLDPVTLSVTQNCYVTLKMKYSTETYELLAPSGTPPENENLVVEVHATIPEPTVDTAHQLIAVVGFDAEKQKITDIYNQCIQPTANPCMLLMPS